MKKEKYADLFLFGLYILICFVIGEVIIRYSGDYDADGNFVFLKRKLRPYYLPARSVQSKINQYLSAPASCIIYDPALGWSPRPNSMSINGIEYYNSDGIRTISSDAKISRQPGKGVLRIAIFGDSYTRADEVLFENSWGYYLENNLKKAGIDAEVLNFGVGAYGIDQAFLRWQKLGREFSPHIVLLGINFKTIERALNIIRPIYSPMTGIPFSKPRYIMEGNNLKLINVPTIGPEKISDTMRNIQSWDLAKYEYWLNLGKCEKKFWLRSKFASAVLYAIDRIHTGLFNKKGQNFWSLDEEASRLSSKIIQEFKKDVTANGARFYAIYFPTNQCLEVLSAGGRLPYSELFKEIEKNVYVIHPENQMISGTANLIFNIPATFHYTAAGNRIVADEITKFIIKQQ